MSVGVLNTLVDVAIFACLSHFGIALILANTISTSCGMALSFTLNRNFTFGAKGESRKRQIILFLVVTLTSQWLIQPVVILIGSYLMSYLQNSNGLYLVAAKLVAISASLVWNYYFYNKYVFSK